MSIPLISVIMPIYNSQKYVRASISILNQSYGDFEFIIINDRSSGNSKNILDSFLDSKIKSISNISKFGKLSKGRSMCKKAQEAKLKSISALYEMPWWKGYTFDSECS